MTQMLVDRSDAGRIFPAAALKKTRHPRSQLAATLELVEFAPARRKFSTPVLFLHGAVGGAWAWCDGFGARIAAAGFHGYALSSRAHGGSSRAQPLDTTGLSDYVADVAWAVNEIGETPILLAQKYLEHSDARGLALLAPLPPQGLIPVMALVAMRHPRIFAEVNAFIHTGRGTKDGLRQALVAGPVPPQRLERHLAALQRESLRALWDAAIFNLPRLSCMRRPPMLVLGADRDALVPPEMARLCATTLGAPYERWEKVADRLVEWLSRLP
jgi:non-heme chloroperoxidase